MSPIVRREPVGEPAPILFESAHSGTVHPPDFGTIAEDGVLRRGEDVLVDQLFARAPEHGITLLAAEVSRVYIDANRAPDDIDPDLLDGPWPTPLAPSEASRRGVGLIWTSAGPDLPLYDRKLSVAEVEARIARVWKPYHDAVARTLADMRARFGVAYHLSCHSMWSVGPETAPDPGARRPDVVLGDRDGTSCDPAFTRAVDDALRRLGYSTAINDPFRGAELVARHGRPAAGVHSLQLELNRALYIDERTLAPHAGFAKLEADLTRLAADIRAFVDAAPKRESGGT